MRRLLDAALLLVVLAAAAATPFFEIMMLGFVFEREGQVARGAPLHRAFELDDAARRVIGAIVGVAIVFAPVLFFRAILREARIVEGRGSAPAWIALGLFAAMTGAHALVAISRGRFGSFFSPGSSLRTLLRPRVEEVGLGAELWSWVKGVFSEALLRGASWLIFGVVGLVGSGLWYLPPAAVVALRFESALAVPALLVGVIALMMVVGWLPFLQAHFAAERRFGAFLELGEVRRRIARAPIAHALALSMLVLASLPLQAFHILALPADAGATIAFVSLLLLYPARLVAAWAYARGGRAPSTAPRVVRGLAFGLRVPALILAAVIALLLPYVAAQGSSAVLESAIFLLPLPR